MVLMRQFLRNIFTPGLTLPGSCTSSHMTNNIYNIHMCILAHHIPRKGDFAWIHYRKTENTFHICFRMHFQSPDFTSCEIGLSVVFNAAVKLS